MKRRSTIFALLMGLCAAVPSINAQGITRMQHGVQVEAADGQKVLLTVYDANIVRTVKIPANASAMPDSSISVIMEPKATKFSVSESQAAVTLATAAVKATVDKASGAVSYFDAKGQLMLAEDGAARFSPITEGIDKGYYQVAQSWALEGDEAIYGLGNLENGRISQRGEHRSLQPGNVEDGITFFQSIKGYGIYWDNYSPTEVSDINDVFTFDSQVSCCVDYYYLQGGNADGVIAAMRHLTGQVPMFPLWTYGFWQSRERYKSQNETLEVATKYRDLGVPIDGMIQDWQYWGNNYLWNAMEFLNGEFPRPQEMIDSIHNMNAKLIISIWSSFGPMTKGYHQMDSIGALFNIGTWPQSGIAEQWPPRRDYPSGVRVYDAYNPEARDIYWQNLTRLYDMDIDGWWMDSTEPDHLDWKPEDMDTPTHMGSFRKMRGAYPILTVGGVHDHQKDVNKDRRVFILTRSAWAGQQRYGCNVWTGDVTSTWDNLRRQTGAMLNFSLTGNPNTNSDLGGFFAGSYNSNWGDGSATRNPAYQELYTRWMQLGAFTPMMRSHGTDVPRELYYYGKAGEPVYDALVDAVKLRYQFLPYIYSTSWDVTNNAGTFMRALPMDFAADKNVWNKSDAFMFGRQLLVAPVLKAQYTPEILKHAENDEAGWNKSAGDNKVKGLKDIDFTAERSNEVYLPAGTDWWDFWTGEKLAGGSTINKATTLATIPLFARAGAIIPLGPDVQYATEKPWDDLQLRIFPGADGEFVLYEDEGDNYNYEQGVYTEIPVSWNDRTRTLTIGERRGTYPGMLSKRQFTAILPDGTTRTIPYSGKKTKTRL